MFLKINVAGFSTATLGKLLFDILSSSSSILASLSVWLPSPRVKYQSRMIPTELLSNVHFNFAVDPGRNVIRVPSGGDVIFPKKAREKLTIKGV